MNNYKILTLFALFSFCFTSCDLFIDKDISGEKITLLSPGDLDTNDSKTQYFWWEENKQIEQYRLQIVHPSFDKPSIMYLDTIIKGKFNFNMALRPDDYEWRLRGENFTSQTPYQTRRLHVDTSYIISSEVVELISPADVAQITFGNSVKLSWEKVPIATSYKIRIESVGFSEEPYTEVKTSNINELVLTDLPYKNFKAETITYRWTVSAINNKSNTETINNPSRTFVVKVQDRILTNQN